MLTSLFNGSGADCGAIAAVLRVEPDEEDRGAGLEIEAHAQSLDRPVAFAFGVAGAESCLFVTAISAPTKLILNRLLYRITNFCRNASRAFRIATAGSLTFGIKSRHCGRQHEYT